ncbi:MAG: D-alanyl-D-alanine carboxypeptidase family protein, partial [Flavobacteriales bacterium]|nr:D-alanyl-D-alanine carboxypeptidase family protein [Flavobacteriales bacterium]
LSRPLYKAYLKLDLKEALSDLDMEGSNHLDQAFLMAYRESHVKGINPALK